MSLTYSKLICLLCISNTKYNMVFKINDSFASQTLNIFLFLAHFRVLGRPTGTPRILSRWQSKGLAPLLRLSVIEEEPNSNSVNEFEAPVFHPLCADICYLPESLQATMPKQLIGVIQ